MSRKHIFILIAAVILLPVAYYLVSPLWRVKVADELSPLNEEFERQMQDIKDVVMVKDDPMPSVSPAASPVQVPTPRILATADFVSHAHEVTGKALLIQNGETKTLRFENFQTLNGPNLHIYLSADLEAKDFIDLGALRATKGNVNYAVEARIDASKYKHVLIWCVPFRVLFGSAELR